MQLYTAYRQIKAMPEQRYIYELTKQLFDLLVNYKIICSCYS